MEYSLGQRVQELRAKKGMSQRALSRAAGVSQPTISAIETNQKTPSIDTARLIANALGCTVAELMGEDIETRAATEDELKFALWGGDAKEITDEQFAEVKKFARFLKERGEL